MSKNRAIIKKKLKYSYISIELISEVLSLNFLRDALVIESAPVQKTIKL